MKSTDFSFPFCPSPPFHIPSFLLPPYCFSLISLPHLLKLTFWTRSCLCSGSTSPRLVSHLLRLLLFIVQELDSWEQSGIGKVSATYICHVKEIPFFSVLPRFWGPTTTNPLQPEALCVRNDVPPTEARNIALCFIFATNTEFPSPPVISSLCSFHNSISQPSMTFSLFSSFSRPKMTLTDYDRFLCITASRKFSITDCLMNF